MKQREYQEGEVIMEEGSAGNSAYLIRSGRVAISRQHEGRTICLATLEEGAIFGEMALVDEKPRSATAKALEYCVLEEITHQDLSKQWEDTPQLVRFVLTVLIERMRSAEAQLFRLAIERTQG